MTAPAWTPPINDVAAIIARLVPDLSGQLTGEFSDTTIPTAAQATDVLEGLLAEVQLLAPSIPDELGRAAGRVVALGAAAQLATSFFPEIPNAMGDRLRQEYLDARALLLTAITRELSDLGGGDAVQVLPIHSLRPLPPYINAYQAPFIDPTWPY